MSTLQDNGASRILGAGFLLTGLLFNPYLITHALGPDRQIASSIYLIYIVAWEIVLGMLGVYFALNRRHAILPKLAIVCASLLVCLFAAEWGVRKFWYKNSTNGWKAPRISSFELNQCGYRGHRIEYNDDDYVILLVGDSQVEASACAYAWMPECRLEYHLKSKGRRARVFTVGSSGYGTDQELLAVREYFQRFRADLVIVWFTPINDIWNNIFPTHWPRNGKPKPTYWLENGALHGPLPNAHIGEIPCTGSRIADIIRRRYVMGGLDPDGFWEKKFLPPAYQALREYKGPVLMDWQTRWDSNLGVCRGDTLANEKAHWAISLTPRSPRMQYGIDLTHALLNEISLSATARRARFCVLIPAVTNPPPVRGEFVHRLNGEFYRTSSDQYDANLKDVTHGFDVFHTAVTLKDHEVGPADDHLNEHAVDQVMESLAAELAAGIPMPANTTTK